MSRGLGDVYKRQAFHHTPLRKNHKKPCPPQARTRKMGIRLLIVYYSISIIRTQRNCMEIPAAAAKFTTKNQPFNQVEGLVKNTIFYFSVCSKCFKCSVKTKLIYCEKERCCSSDNSFTLFTMSSSSVTLTFCFSGLIFPHL